MVKLVGAVLLALALVVPADGHARVGSSTVNLAGGTVANTSLLVPAASYCKSRRYSIATVSSLSCGRIRKLIRIYNRYGFVPGFKCRKYNGGTRSCSNRRGVFEWRRK